MKNVFLYLVLLAPLFTNAHTGHGPVDDGLAHYVLSPIHLIGVLAFGLVAYGIYQFSRAKKKGDA